MPAIPDSILQETKKVLGYSWEYTAFDTDIIQNINAVFATLTQLGIGPVDGFEITDDSTLWADYTLGNPKMNPVKSYVYLRLRLLFDPPEMSFHVSSLQEQARELEVRLQIDFDPPLVLVEEDVDG